MVHVTTRRQWASIPTSTWFALYFVASDDAVTTYRPGSVSAKSYSGHAGFTSCEYARKQELTLLRRVLRIVPFEHKECKEKS